MISHLITEGYLNEERFAKAFAGGKFRVKNWGNIKIIQSARSQRSHEKLYSHAGLKEIDEADYAKRLNFDCKEIGSNWMKRIYM